MLSMFENDLIVIENGMLCRCRKKNLLTLSVPDGTEAIADSVFKDCPKLSEIILPPTLTKIGNHAFENCSALEAIDLSYVDTIGEAAFAYCSSLEKVSFSDKIGYLCNDMFLGCIGMKEISLPNNVAYIGCECFKDCYSLIVFVKGYYPFFLTKFDLSKHKDFNEIGSYKGENQKNNANIYTDYEELRRQHIEAYRAEKKDKTQVSDALRNRQKTGVSTEQQKQEDLDAYYKSVFDETKSEIVSFNDPSDPGSMNFEEAEVIDWHG